MGCGGVLIFDSKKPSLAEKIVFLYFQPGSAPPGAMALAGASPGVAGQNRGQRFA